ncbi:diaminopimelate epimerase [Helicobacter mustelae]|uniref:Diaminopimelate epimerase n=1 Tax=Helicobacter mustelae (strain ATCC 43772 / CCUG 25715 / CIP 103759 / LMG 18044 / NCTC 12198 / R85-136P) TaxID=679897 RepID=D3UFT0_HELM1|nr:diaminopimelate epimerase [Helicobacter mustelae]CBG39351.1 putative diaminopimelate epimerase [Helicobacter mustelae 12198]SQH70861.1 diaminopimelate epimerase [Helicobacter mustelae]STP11989.1 diaminopimelate epimerase [Helicobacter mustelae]
MIVEKYSGSGNDFLITHLCQHPSPKDLAKELCHRHLGIGADGFIILKPHQTYAYAWEFYNSDGSSALMCGNASRCVAHYANKHHLAKAQHIFWAGARAIEVHVKKNTVATHLGKPSTVETLSLISSYASYAYKIDTGVPHLVIFAKSQKSLPAYATQELKDLREEYNANVNVVYAKNPKTLYVHTYERGVEDITLACGTGMAAASGVYHFLHPDHCLFTCLPPSREELILKVEEQNIIFEGKVRHIATCYIDA